MVTPSKSLIMNNLFDSVNEWIQNMCDSVSVAAGEAYAAGNFHAVGQLRAGVSFDVVQKDALEYAKTYRQNLVERGEIQVSRIQYGEDGKPLKNKNGTIKRADETVKWLAGSNQQISSDIADIIQRGIAEGKPTGVRQLSSGGYPSGSIAEELNQYITGYKSRASTIARTETARNYYHGEQSRYSKAGVQYVQYLGAADACEECLPYIGKVFELGTEPPLPIHPNCRCDYRPLSSSDKDYPADAITAEDEIRVPEGWDNIGVEDEVTTQQKPTNKTEYKTNWRGEIDMSSFTTIDEVQKAVVKGYGQTKFKIDPELVNDGFKMEVITDQFTRLGRVFSDFSSDSKIISNLKRAPDHDVNAYAACGPQNPLKQIANLYYEDGSRNKTEVELRIMYENDVASSYHPTGTSNSDIMIHEFAHCVDWRITALRTTYYDDSVRMMTIDVPERIKLYQDAKPIIRGIAYEDEGHKFATDIIISAAERVKNESYSMSDINDKQFRKGLKRMISNYATDYGDYETMAEAFASYYANPNGCSTYARYIVEESIAELKRAHEFVEGELRKFREHLEKSGKMKPDEIEEELTKVRNKLMI